MKTEAQTNEEAILKAIMSGAYRHQYLIYNRKSTDEPNNQKNSIRYQRLENVRSAQGYHLPIAPITLSGLCADGIISEKHSGFKEDAAMHFSSKGTVQFRIERPKFYRLVEFLNKGYFKGIVVLCWDRVSRNRSDSMVIKKLMKRGVDFHFALAVYDKNSAGALHMDIDDVFAVHHSRVTSEKVSLTIADLRSQGFCTYKAPIGYLNPGSVECKPLDPKRAPIIKRLFEEYATGRYSLADLARCATMQGLTMPAVRRRRTEEEILAEEDDEVLLKIEPVERPIVYTNIHKILTNPFYTGKVLGVGNQYIQSRSHEALVSEELFKKVQGMLSSKKVSQHYTRKLNYPYRGIIRCGECNRIYTPYMQKGILYFGSRCAKACGNELKNINQQYLETSIGTLIQKLSFTEDELAEIEKGTAPLETANERKQEQERISIDRRKRKIGEDLSYLQTNKLLLLRSGVYSPETFIVEESKLKIFLAEIEVSIEQLAASTAEFVTDLKLLSELLKSLYFYYEGAVSTEKEDCVRSLFSELSIVQKSLKIKDKNGLEVLQSRFYFVGDLKTWISEAVRCTKIIEQSTHDVQQIMSARPPPGN